MTVDLAADPSASSDDARGGSATGPSPDPHASMPRAGRFAGHLHFDETITPALLTDFDVAAYVRRGTSRLPVDSALHASQEPLRAAERLALGMLQRLESSALAESRMMLSTVTANEARITAFLATWLVDRHWQGRALRDLLTGDDPVERPEPGRRPSPSAVLRRVHVDRVQPLLTPLWNAAAGEAITAGHMARMAIQEATLQAGLQALAPQLHGEARRVVEWAAERHEDPVRFFRAEAIARITRSRREALTARAVLTLTSPLDGGGVPDPDLAAALAVIGTDPDRRAAVHRARFEITRLLPGPDLPQRHLAALSRTGV